MNKEKKSYTMTSISLGKTHDESIELVKYWHEIYRELVFKLTENGKHILNKDFECSGCGKKLVIKWEDK